MLKKTAKLSKDELTKVAGGTVKEFEELLSAFDDNKHIKRFYKVTTHLPAANNAAATFVESFMSDKMGIDANISLGVGGTGLFSKHNTYSEIGTGRALSHGEVLERVKFFDM